MIKNHTQLLNFLTRQYHYQSYLEIGVQDRRNNFDQIEIKYRIGVDPEAKSLASFRGTSDEFFSMIAPTAMRFDLVFIDGLHHADQVAIDFYNAATVLSPAGRIVLHDTNPEHKDLTGVPRDKTGRWLGDVYRFVSALSDHPDKVRYVTLDCDNGCTVVELLPAYFEEGIVTPYSTDFETFASNKKRFLNLVTPEEFLKLSETWQ